jgi:hypothetical protein
MESLHERKVVLTESLCGATIKVRAWRQSR